MALAGFFEDDAVPMMQMLHLRQLDFPISRGVSYERTVDEFLLQLGTNDGLRSLRAHREMAVLLNEEGALVREDGQWTLYFTPGRSECLTLAPDADLCEVMRSLQEKHRSGEVCSVRLPERSLKTLVSGLAPFCILDEYCKNAPGGYLAMAKKIVLEGPEELFRHVPVCRYGALTTVDLTEIENYHTINSLLDDYVYSCEHCGENETVKPLSIAVFGPPGSGKSFGVKQIATSRGRFHITSLNLSQYDDPVSLFQAMDLALHCEAGKIPLVFFDEFDAERDGVTRGWLKYFLAPMQDGEYTVDGKLCTISGAVFVFAGATASSFAEFLPSGKEAETAFQLIKGPDFVSRLKGILNIQGPNPTCVTDRRYMVRRALLFRNLIMNAVPGIFDEPGGHANISPGLLSSLLRVSEYRHGSRSIELLIGMSRLTGAKRYTPSCLPIDAQLDIHLDVKDFRAKLAFEQIMGGRTDQYAEIAHRKYQEKRRSEAKSLVLLASDLNMVAKHVREIPSIAIDLVEVNDAPMTIIYPGAQYLAPNVVAEDGSVGIRIPMNEFCVQLVRKLRRPLVSTSANISGEDTPSCFAEISPEIVSAVDYVVPEVLERESTGRASQIIKLGLRGEVQIIRP